MLHALYPNFEGELQARVQSGHLYSYLFWDQPDVGGISNAPTPKMARS